MSGWIVIVGNAAVAVSNVVDGNVAARWPAATFPEWIQVGLGALALMVGIAVAVSVRVIADKLPKTKDDAKHEFTRMLCSQVWLHTDAITSRFQAHLRNDPVDLTTLHVLLRNLREELAAPVHFVDQMRAQAPSNWPNYGLLGSFSNWAGQLTSMSIQLAEHQAALIYPPGKDAADKYRDQMLVHKFLTERTVLQRGISQLRSNAFAFCAVAKNSLPKPKPPKAGEEEEAHVACPCCRKHDEHVLIKATDPLVVAPLPVEPKPPAPPPPPAPKPCVCVMPMACRCTPACSCACQCQQKPPAAA